MSARDSPFEMRLAANFTAVCCALSFACLVACSALLDTGSLTGGRRNGGGAGGDENGGASSEAGAAGDSGGNTANGGDAPGGGGGGAQGGSAGGSNMAGGGGASAGASGASAGAGGAPCNKTNGGKETCDGRDNDCNPATPDCPAGCTAFTAFNVRYMACNKLAKWNNAELACLQQTMELAQLETSAENAAVTAKLQELKIAGEVWIGGESDAQNNTTFEWVDGTVIFQNGKPAGGVYQNFAPNQPASLAAPSSLQLATANDASAGTWSNALPSTAQAFVCKEFAF